PCGQFLLRPGVDRAAVLLIADAGGVHLDRRIQSGFVQALGEHHLGHRRAADVAGAHHQHPVGVPGSGRFTHEAYRGTSGAPDIPVPPAGWGGPPGRVPERLLGPAASTRCGGTGPFPARLGRAPAASGATAPTVSRPRATRALQLKRRLRSTTLAPPPDTGSCTT